MDQTSNTQPCSVFPQREATVHKRPGWQCTHCSLDTAAGTVVNWLRPRSPLLLHRRGTCFIRRGDRDYIPSYPCSGDLNKSHQVGLQGADSLNGAPWFPLPFGTSFLEGSEKAGALMVSLTHAAIEPRERHALRCLMILQTVACLQMPP